MNIKSRTMSFNDVRQSIKSITDTENTFHIEASNFDKICNISNYSEYGLKSLGKAVGFPANFITEISTTNSSLANKIIRDRVTNFCDKNKRELYAREFYDKIYGIVTDKYSYFDDNEVMNIINDSPLAKYRFQYALTTPERLHLRAIDLDNPFTVDNDDSNLYMLYYIDNSMVGKSAFKIRVGVYRQVCENGMIIPINDFILCRAVHRGRKDIAAEFSESVEFLSEKKGEIQKIVSQTTAETATIQELQDDFKKTYVAKELQLNNKEAEKVITIFNTYTKEYGTPSKWAFINAVTEFAKELPAKSIEKRILLESKALKVA